MRTVCNSVEILKKRDKFSKRLLEKVKNKRIYHKWNIAQKKRFCNRFWTMEWKECPNFYNKMLDEEFETWRNRPIREAVKYLLLDARYEKVRVDGNVVDCALLIAYGIQDDGHRRVLGVSVELSETEAHWRKFLESLSERGLHGVEMITSDNHAGLKAARMSVFPSVPW